MKEFNYTITDPQGIHARPASTLIKETAQFKSKIELKTGEKVVNAKALLAIMSLGIKCGQEMTVMIEGEDEEAAASHIEAFLKENL